MTNPIIDGLASVDATGLAILSTTGACLLGAVGAHIFVRAAYEALQRDLERNAKPRSPFHHAVLDRIFTQSEDAARRSPEPNTQAIIEDAFQSELRPLLLAERFVRASTGLVIILGLLGTFYGLTLSIGRLVHLISSDTGAAADVTRGLAQGLSQALAGMAVAFSNSLVGVLSAVVLTVLGILSCAARRRRSLSLCRGLQRVRDAPRRRRVAL